MEPPGLRCAQGRQVPAGALFFGMVVDRVAHRVDCKAVRQATSSSMNCRVWALRSAMKAKFPDAFAFSTF